MSIKDDATTLLIRLAQLQRTHSNLRTEYIDGPELNKLLPIGPERLSDAVALLEESGYPSWLGRGMLREDVRS